MDEWLLLQEGVYVYILLFLLLLGGAFMLPIPEDIPLILGGVLVQMGRGRLDLIAAVCYGAIILGDVFIFGVGRWLGPALFQKPWFRKRIGYSRVKNLRVSLEKRSLPMIFIARHLFYLRTVTFLTCGAVRMSFGRFLISDAIAALVSVPFMLLIGYLAAEHYEAVFNFIARAKYWSVVVGVLILFACLAWYFMRRRRRALNQRALQEGDSGERAPQEPSTGAAAKPDHLI